MAMIYCRECGAKHSDKANACPKCGYQAVCDGKSVLVYALLALLFGITISSTINMRTFVLSSTFD